MKANKKQKPKWIPLGTKRMVCPKCGCDMFAFMSDADKSWIECIELECGWSMELNGYKLKGYTLIGG